MRAALVALVLWRHVDPSTITTSVAASIAWPRSEVTRSYSYSAVVIRKHARHSFYVAETHASERFAISGALPSLVIPGRATLAGASRRSGGDRRGRCAPAAAVLGVDAVVRCRAPPPHRTDRQEAPSHVRPPPPPSPPDPPPAPQPPRC